MAEKSKNGLLWAIGIALIALGAVYFSVAPTTNTPVKIGVLTPVTGGASVYGTAMRQAYDLAVGEINEAGGIEGRQIELVYEDGACDGDAATAATQKLIETDQVEFILGGTCSAETEAAALAIADVEVLLLSPGATTPGAFDDDDLVYHMLPSSDFEGREIAKHAFENDLATAAVISEDTDFAQGARDRFEASYEGEMVFSEVFGLEETSFWTMLTNARTADPDVVYVIAQNPETRALILEQMSQLYLDAVVYASHTLPNYSAVMENLPLYEGVYLTSLQLPESEKTTAMMTQYQETYGVAPELGSLSLAAYDSVYLIAEALGSGAEGATSVSEYLDTQVVDWEGATGVINFDEHRNTEIGFTFFQIVNGEVVASSTGDDGAVEEEIVEESDDSHE